MLIRWKPPGIRNAPRDVQGSYGMPRSRVETSLPEPSLVDPRVRVDLVRFEEQGDLAFRALRRIGTVDDVASDGEAEVPPDRPRIRLRGIRLAHHLPDRRDRAVSFEAGDDFADEGPLHGVRLEQDERTLGHVMPLSSPSSRSARAPPLLPRAPRACGPSRIARPGRATP